MKTWVIVRDSVVLEGSFDTEEDARRKLRYLRFTYSGYHFQMHRMDDTHFDQCMRTLAGLQHVDVRGKV